MARILVIKGPNPGQSIELERDKFTLGRNPDCDLVIAGPSISREHAQILRINNQFFVKDLKSRNKTYVNNQEVHPDIPVKLAEDDKIKICEFLFSFHDRVEKPPLPKELAGEEPEAPEKDDEGPSTIMSTLGPEASSNLLLESAPAERLRILLEITNSLSRTLEIESLLPKILDQLFQIFRQADRAFIVIREPQTRKLIPKAIKTRRERDETTARFSRNILNQCIDTGQAFLSEDASADNRFAMSQSITDFRIRSVMCAPLRAGEGPVFGVLQLDTQDRVKKFTQEDLQLLVAVSNQAAVAMENAKLHEDVVAREKLQRDLALAKEVQRGFLPATPPTVAGYEFFAFYQAANDVGGDFYNFIEMPNGRMAVAVGDVAGKGMPAALLMARLSADARFCLSTEPDPARAVGKLNEILQHAGLQDRFITFAIAVIDPSMHQITIVNAGHIPPLVRRASTGALEEIASGDRAGLPLGITESFDYDACQVVLQPGDCVILCSDGVTDAMSAAGETFGNERFMQTIKAGAPPAGSLGKHLLKTIEQHAAGGHHQHDDITIVCFGRNA